jgi:hypothetical protein
VFAAIVALVTVAGSAALATTPASTPHMSTSCYSGQDRQRAVEVQSDGSCIAGQTRLTQDWATNAIMMRWGSGAVVQMPQAGGVSVVALYQPGNKVPAGTWSVTATVLIAHSQNVNSFRCWTITAGTKVMAGGQLQDWGGAGGWHRTMTIPGLLVNMAQPDWIDVYCSHDYNITPAGGVVQIESVEVFAQQIT